MSAARYFVGVGCRRGCSAQSLHTLLQQILRECALSIEQIAGIASIDTKKSEACIIELAENLALPLTFFPAKHLNTFADRISDVSAAALAATGSPSVAEASALALASLHAGTAAQLIGNKSKKADATCAVARAPIG